MRNRRDVGPQRPIHAKIFEILARQIDQFLVIQIARGGDQNIRRRVIALIIIVDHGAIERAHRVLGADDGLAERMVFIEIAGEDVVEQVLGIVHFHLQLFEDDALFLFDVRFPKQRIAHHVGQDVEGQRQMLVQDLGVVTDHLLGGERVEAAADGIHRARDVFGRAVLGALEEHVLDEMRDAVLGGSFAARAGLDPDTERHTAHVRHLLTDDTHSVFQGCCFDIADSLNCGSHFTFTYILSRFQAGSGQAKSLRYNR